MLVIKLNDDYIMSKQLSRNDDQMIYDLPVARSVVTGYSSVSIVVFVNGGPTMMT